MIGSTVRPWLPRALLALVALTSTARPAAAQFGDLIDRAGDALGDVPGLSSFLEGDPPITTSLDDARTEIAFLDGYSPASWAPLGAMPRTSDGAFRLRPGRFAFEAQSYCMHAGTHGPGGGDGYLYAPLAGPKAPIVRSILRNSVQHPEIPQRNVQVLIWAIIARTEFGEMPGEVQRTARALLTEDQIEELDDGALGMVPESVMREAMSQLPPGARQVFQAEARLRSMLSSGSSSFAELERVAVLTGAATPTEDSRPVPEGRWSFHPDGFFVRYDPRGYSHTRIEIAVPRPVTMARDAQGRIVKVVEGSGRKIEVAYEEASAEVPGDPGVRAYGLESVLVVPPDGSATPISSDAGWTLVGVPAGGGRAAATGRFVELADRYRSAVDWRDEWRDLTGRRMTDRALADALDLAQLQLAIGAAGATPGGSDSAPAAQEALVSLAEAWQSAVCASAGCPSVSGVTDVLVLRNGDVRLGALVGCGGGACLLGGSSVGLESIAWIGLSTIDLPPSAQQMEAGEVHLEDGTVRPGELRAMNGRYVWTTAGGFDRSAVAWIHVAGAEETPPSLVMPPGGPAREPQGDLPEEDDERDDDDRDDGDREDGSGGGGAFTFDPSDDVATPGNRSRQRLATSSRPQESDDSTDDDICTSGFPEGEGLVSLESCPPCAAAARNLNQAGALMDADIVDFDTWNEAFWGYAECIEAHGAFEAGS